MPQPNILFMISHDCGQHLGCYGVPTVQSPNLDRLAAEGIRLENSYCVAPQCSPSRAAIFTGRYPHSNGVMGLTHGMFAWDLYPGERHLANHLQDAGYHTALIGGQHERARPEDTGYEYLFPKAKAAEVGVAAAAHLEKLRDSPGPWYVQVGFFEPHRTFEQWAPPDEENGVTVPPFIKDEPTARQDFAGYQGAIKSMDAAAGGILRALDRLGLAENTLVVFTVDHGMPFPLAKCSLYDPGLQTAYLCRWPERGWAGGRVLDPMIPNVDYLPTLLEALGLTVPASVQGRSFAALLDGEPYARRDATFAEMTYHDYYDPMRCIRTETHKLIAFFSACKGFMNPSQEYRPRSRDNDKWPSPWPNCRHKSIELYDRTAEPWEKTDLSGNPEHEDLRRRLMARLYRWMVDTGDPLLHGIPPSPTHVRTMEMLAASARGRGLAAAQADRT